MSSVYKLIPELAALMQTFSGISGQDNLRQLDEMKRFLTLSDGQTSWMRLQGGAVAVFGIVAGLSQFAVGCFPKNAAPTTPASALDVRLNANAGVTDMLSQAWEALKMKLQNDDFMRSTFKAAGKGLPQVGTGVQILFQSRIDDLGAEKTLCERCDIPRQLEMQSGSDDAARKATEAASRVIEAKSRGA